MINQVRERLKEIKFLTESIELGKREYCPYDTIIGADFTAINMILLYEDGIDSFEYLQNLYNEHLGKYPRDWKNDVWGKSLWEEVKIFVKDNDDVEL